MNPGPSDPWLKRAELFVRRWFVRMLGGLVHRRSPAPSPRELTSARILLIRQDRIGDVLVSTPLIDALRRHLPGSTIDMLVSTNNVAALAGIPVVHRSWVYERTLASLVRLVQMVRQERYDVAVDLMDNPSATSTAFCVLSGARWTVGLAKENDFSYDVRIPLLSRKDKHIIERLAPIAGAFGIPAEDAATRVIYTPLPSSKAEARALYASVGCLERRKVGVNISAGHERRYWGTDRFREIINFLRRVEPESAIIIGSKPSDFARANEIARGFEHVFALPAQKSFDVFAATVSHLDMLLTPDTSVVHLASAFTIPSVVMFIQSNPDLRVWEPFETPHVSVITTVDDLRDISVGQIEAAWIELRRLIGGDLFVRSLRMEATA